MKRDIKRMQAVVSAFVFTDDCVFIVESFLFQIL